MPRAPATPRRLVETFAGHLAHLLNTGAGDTVRLAPYDLYQSLSQTLASGSYRRLIGFGLAGPDKSAEQVAQEYFDAVLDRRLFLKGSQPTHKGHELFLALCRRGSADGWTVAALRRDPKTTNSRGASPASTQEYSSPDRVRVAERSFQQLSDFPSVAGRLAKLDHSISPGNPAATTRAKLGALLIEAGEGDAVVPEELSVWNGICSAPERLRMLAHGKPFDAFCSLVIKAVEAANAPFGAVISLGLSPRDWAGELTTNTAKKLGAFLSEVRGNGTTEDNSSGGEGSGGLTDFAIWRRIWEHRQVPGYASADELWNSALGRAIRFPAVAREVEIEWLEDTIEQVIVRDGEFMFNDRDFRAILPMAALEGIIDDFDAWLLEMVRDGNSLEDLKLSPKVRLRLGRNGELVEYFDELTERLLEWSRVALSGDHPDNTGNTREDQ